MDKSIRISTPWWALFLLVACLCAPIVQSNHILRQNSKVFALKIENFYHSTARNTKRILQNFVLDDDDSLNADDDLINDEATEYEDFLNEITGDENFTQCALFIDEMDPDERLFFEDANSKFLDSQIITEDEEELYIASNFDETARAEYEATCDGLGGIFLSQEVPISCTFNVFDEMATYESAGEAFCYPDFEPCRNFDYTKAAKNTLQTILVGDGVGDCDASPLEDFAVLVTAPPSPQPEITFDDLTGTAVGNENFTQCALLINDMYNMDRDEFRLFDDAKDKFLDSLIITEDEEELYIAFDYDETARAEYEATCDGLGGIFLSQEVPLSCTIDVFDKTKTFEYAGDATCYPDFEPCRNFDFMAIATWTFQKEVEFMDDGDCDASPLEDFAVLVTAPPSPQPEITFEDITVTTVGASPGKAIEEPRAGKRRKI